MGYIKCDIERFDYNKKYTLPEEHKWDELKDSDEEKKYFEEREKAGKPSIGRVQSDPETTGQIGTMI